MKFKIIHWTGDADECECCGFYQPEATYVFINDEEIWHTYTDNHLNGSQTETSLLDAILSKMKMIEIEKIENDFSEESRLKWNQDHPGNGIARTPESWLEYKNGIMSYIDTHIDDIKQSTEHLPHSIDRQVRMIALWIEDVTGCDDISVSIESSYESEEG